MRNSARIKHIVLSILFVIASINFTKTTLDIVKSSKRLDNLKGDVVALEQQKKEAEANLEYKKTDDYIEEKARNDLNMVKPGEKIYVVVGQDNSQKDTVLGASIAKKTISISNTLRWKQNLRDWYELFF